MDIFRMLLRVIMSAFDIVFPRRIHAARIENVTATDIPLVPSNNTLCGQPIVTLMDYRASAVRDLIHALKYERSPHAAEICASVLCDYLHKELPRIAKQKKKIVLVPIPLHRTRLKERGYNQIERVLQQLPREFTDGTRARVETGLLIRKLDTPHQTSLPRSERLRNVTGAFALNLDTNMRHMHIFLIDDVVTTGATLTTAARELKKAQATVTLVSLARA